MIVDGFITEVHLDGEFSQAVQWKPFAIGKLRDLLRAGFRGQTVMQLGEDVKLRVAVNRETQLAKVWVEAGGWNPAFIANAIKLKPGVADGIGDTDTILYGLPYKDENGGEIEPPVGTASGKKPYWKIQQKQTVVDDAPEVTFAAKKSAPVAAEAWGANDWVHKVGGKVKGFVTWGTVPGRSTPLSRREYEIQDVFSTGPTPVFAPYVFSGTSKKTAVYYNGKLVTDAAPGIVWGAALFVGKNKKTYLRGVSGKDTKGIQFVSGGYVFRMAKDVVAWEMELGAAPKKTPEVVATLELPGGVPYIFDTEALFAFNESATKCSGVIRVGASLEEGYDPWIDGGITSIVAHFTWDESGSVVGTTEGVPEVTERTGAIQITQSKSGFKSVSESQGSSVQQTVAIDYVGDDEVRLEWRESFNTATEVNESFAIVQEYTFNDRSWADAYVAATATTSSSTRNVVFTYRGAELLAGGDAVVLEGGGTFSEAGVFTGGGHTLSSSENDIRLLYADLRYGVFVVSKVTASVGELVQYYYAGGGPGDVTRGVDHRLFLIAPNEEGVLGEIDITRPSSTSASHTYADHPNKVATPDGFFIWGVDKKDRNESSTVQETWRACPTQQKCWSNYHIRKGSTPAERVLRGYMHGVSAATLPGKTDAKGEQVEADVTLLSLKYRPIVARPFDSYSIWFGDPVVELEEQAYTYLATKGDVRKDTRMDLLGGDGFIRSVGLT